MKIIYSVLLLLIITSCNQQDKRNDNEEDIKEPTNKTLTSTPNKTISFSGINSKGILIGKKIILLDSFLNTIRDISDLNESFVDITAISDSLYKKNENDDYCEEFKYVKIKSKDFEGIIDGRLIFEPVKSLQNKKYKDIELVITSCFGIGSSNEDGLTFCSENTPIILTDNKSGFEGLIPIITNDYYTSKFGYFQLEGSDGTYDEIVEIKEVDGNYHLQIKREYQEGSALFTVEISKNDAGIFVAKILNKETLEM